MLYLMKSGLEEFNRNIVYRHGKATTDLNRALRTLKKLPYNSELRDDHNNLVAVKARQGVIEVSKFVQTGHFDT